MSALACLTCNFSCFGPYDSFHERFGFSRNVSFTAILDIRAPWYLSGGSMLVCKFHHFFFSLNNCISKIVYDHDPE